jgi:hypothetical protein
MKTGGSTAECVVVVESDEVTYAVNSTETWTAALAAISAAEDGSKDSPKVFVLHITGDFGVRGYSSTYPNIAGAYKEVWLTGDKTISLDFSIPDTDEGTSLTGFNSIITARANQTFIIDGPTLKGNAEHSSSLVYISANSMVEFRSGNLIDNTNCHSNGPGVCTGGTFTMKGGTISGNNGGSGGGVYVTGNGTFTMDGGTITGNGDTSYQGGGVIITGGTFIMNGGSITNNKAKSYGGGVQCFNGKTFIMNGGTISGNTPNGVFGPYTYNGGDLQAD